jgi:hypothetical protein
LIKEVKGEHLLSQFKEDAKEEIMSIPTKAEITSKSRKDDISDSTKEEVISENVLNDVVCKIEDNQES